MNELATKGAELEAVDVQDGVPFGAAVLPIRRDCELEVIDAVAEVLALRDAYSSATKVFNDFLQERGLGWTAEGVTTFTAWLREPHDGKRLAANSVNYYVKGVKA
jgi:hypothetical protein